MGKDKTKFLSWSSVVGTLATTVLAVTSLITVWITISAWNDEREASRPYFTFKESPMVDLDHELSFEISLSNVGSHPAVNLWNKAVIFNSNLKEKPVSMVENILVNDIPKDTTSSLIITISKDDIHPTESNIDPYFIVVVLKYHDPIIDRDFGQTIYLRWNGVIEGELQPFYSVEMAEKQNILDYIKKQGIDLDLSYGQGART